MVALVTIGCVTIAVSAVYIGKWLKRIAQGYEDRYNERLKAIQDIDKDLKEYAARKRDNDNGGNNA